MDRNTRRLGVEYVEQLVKKGQADALPTNDLRAMAQFSRVRQALHQQLGFSPTPGGEEEESFRQARDLHKRFVTPQTQSATETPPRVVTLPK